jgi:hypothetical protein
MSFWQNGKRIEKATNDKKSFHRRKKKMIPKSCPFNEKIVELTQRISQKALTSDYPEPFPGAYIYGVWNTYNVLKSDKKWAEDARWNENAQWIENTLKMLAQHSVVDNASAFLYLEKVDKRLSAWAMIKAEFDEATRHGLDQLKEKFLAKREKDRSDQS